MGTKANPGKYDCLKNLAEDEPFFVLRAQDVLAAGLVDLWADKAVYAGRTPIEKIDEARRCAAAMREWPKKKVPD
jgi:hypothetical protein